MAGADSQAGWETTEVLRSPLGQVHPSLWLVFTTSLLHMSHTHTHVVNMPHSEPFLALGSAYPLFSLQFRERHPTQSQDS